MARVVGVAVEPPAQVLESGELTPRHRLELASGARPVPEREEVVEAERGVAERVGPGGIDGPLGEPSERPSGPPSRPACTRRTAAASGRACSPTRIRRPRDPTPSRTRSSRRSMTALSSIDEPRIPPVTRRSVGTSSATCRRQKPCFRSRSARKPMSRTRSLMIASIIAFSDLARTAQIGQPAELHRLAAAGRRRCRPPADRSAVRLRCRRGRTAEIASGSAARTGPVASRRSNPAPPSRRRAMSRRRAHDRAARAGRARRR